MQSISIVINFKKILPCRVDKRSQLPAKITGYLFQLASLLGFKRWQIQPPTCRCKYTNKKATYLIQPWSFEYSYLSNALFASFDRPIVYYSTTDAHPRVSLLELKPGECLPWKEIQILLNSLIRLYSLILNLEKPFSILIFFLKLVTDLGSG